MVALAVRERRQSVLPRPAILKRHIMVYGFVVAVLYQVLFLLEIERTTAGNTGLMMATVPAWTALLARFFIGAKLPGMAWADCCWRSSAL